MQRFVWVLSLLLAFLIENGTVSKAVAQDVKDDREASFLPPPAALLPLTTTDKPLETPKSTAAKEADKPAEASKADKAKPEQSVSEAREAAKASAEVLSSPPPFKPEVNKPEVKEEKKTEAQPITPKPIEPEAKAPQTAAPVPTKDPAPQAQPQPPVAAPIKEVVPATIKEESKKEEVKTESVRSSAPAATTSAMPAKDAAQTPNKEAAPKSQIQQPAEAQKAGEASARSNLNSVDPGSGTGGITVLSSEAIPTPVLPDVKPTTPAVVEAPLPPPASAASPISASAPAPKAAEAKIVSAPMSDVDPETVGTLSPANGGLGSALWKDTSRTVVDRLLPFVALPTPSATLNDLAKRMFLTTAALPTPPANGEKPKRSMVAQRIEALMALGAVPDAWALAGLSDPALVDPVTLRLLAEAAIISPESKEVCDKIPSLIAVHGKTEEAGAEWQKSLLICQLQAKDMKAVQLGVDLMREQKSSDVLFLSLVSKNVLGEAKQLPRQLTPLRAPTLSVLRFLGLPLPPELFARPEASLIPELLQAKAVDDKARLGLAERAGARGILTPVQLAHVFKGVEISQQDIERANASNEISPRTRAMAYQAALNEQGALKKVELAQRFIAGVEPSVLTGAQIKLAADIVDTVPVTTDQNAFSVIIARLFAMAGRPDKALAWVKLARDTAPRNPEIAAQLDQNWPLFVLLGIVSDGEYAQGMKAWLASALSEGAEGKDIHDKREKTGKLLMLLNAAGYAVPEDAWQSVIEVTVPVKQMTPSPLLTERLRHASSTGRKGETVLLALLLSGGGVAADVPFGLMCEIVRSLRLVGLTAEAQALARETLVGLTGW